MPHVNSINARGWEAHLKIYESTEAFDTVYYDLGDDRSTTQGKFQTVNGLPWALIIGSAWSHPRENIDITDAYPQFKRFAESTGNQNTTWFDYLATNKAID